MPEHPLRLFAVGATTRCGDCWGYFSSLEKAVEACGPEASHSQRSRLLPPGERAEVTLAMPDGSRQRYRKLATWTVWSEHCGAVEVVELELLRDQEKGSKA